MTEKLSPDLLFLLLDNVHGHEDIESIVNTPPNVLHVVLLLLLQLTTINSVLTLSSYLLRFLLCYIQNRNY